MAVPDILLKRPYVLVSLSSSGLSIDSSQAFGWFFCTVEKIYQTCDSVAVGDSGIIEPEKGVKLIYGSSIYFMIDEQAIAFTEVIPP